MPDVTEGMRAWNEIRRVALPDEAITAMFHQGATAAEIAAHYGCSTYPVKSALRRLGLRRAAKRRAGRGVGEDNPAWRGGRRMRPDGYVMVWTPDGERLEHRVVMEASLGRRLLESEIVHHRDGDKSNNDPGNLQVMSQSEHARHHAPEMHRARYGR